MTIKTTPIETAPDFITTQQATFDNQGRLVSIVYRTAKEIIELASSGHFDPFFERPENTRLMEL